MKKLLIVATVVLGALLVLSPLAGAEDFPISVNIPPAQTADFVVWKLADGQPFPTVPETSNAIAFTTTLDSNLGVFFADNFYAIDVSPQGGAGQLNVLATYTDTGNPNGTPGDDTGLEIKGIATAVKADPVTNNEVQLYRQLLRDVTGGADDLVLATTLEATPPGFMRLYVGLATGDPLLLEPTDAEPFNVGDIPGDYTGTLTLTATAP